MATIEQFVAQLAALPKAMLQDALPELGIVVRKSLVNTINAGETPDHVKWAPRKRGDAPVLVHAEAALHVGAIGGRIYIRLAGIEARHHRGRVKGGTKREVILTTHLTPDVVAAMRKVLDRRFAEATSATT